MKAELDVILKSLLVPILLLPTTMWASDRAWRMLRDQTSDTTQARVVGLLLFCICVLAFYASKFYRDVHPFRRDSRMRRWHTHDTLTDMSSSRSGTLVCTRCLYKTPALIYPLHDPCGHGRWECGGCGAIYESATFKAAQKARLEEKEKNQKRGDSSYA